MHKQVHRFVTALCMLAASHVVAQQQPVFNWVKTMGGTSGEGGESIAIDHSGNIYTVGQFAGTPDFDPGSGLYNMTATGSTADAFITKFDASGNFLWARQFGGPGSDVCFDIAVDSAGNIYTAGMFQDSVDFNPGPGVLNKYSSNSGRNTFVTKMDGNGTLLWVAAWDTTANSQADGYSIILDSIGNVFVAGGFEGTVDFNPADSSTYSMTVGQGSYLVKLDNAGNFLWARQLGGIGVGGSTDVVLDSVNNIYLTGSFQGTADFDPGVGVSNLISAGQSDIFVCKLDSAGSYIWAKKLGGTVSDFGVALAVDGAGNVYSTGQFGNTADFDPGTAVYNLTAPGNYSAYISKLDANGNFTWAKVIAYNSYGGDIVLDGSANVYTTGAASGGDFDPGPGSYPINAVGVTDVYIHKLDVSGNFVWARMFGGGSVDGGAGIQRDSNGSIFTTGSFSYTADFDITSGVYTINSVSNSDDVFVHKIGESSLNTPELTSDASLQLYPNPTNGMITILFNGQVNNNSVTITDLIGRVVLQQQLPSGTTASFDLSGYETGIYMIAVTSGNQTVSKKVVLAPH